MAEQNNDDMDSLFEGMVLFTPQEVVKNDGTSQANVIPSTLDGSISDLSKAPSLSSEPLDENLFSDLTVITPSHVETETKMNIPPDPSPVIASTTSNTDSRGAPNVTISRQMSRKKKRGGLRIGYARDPQLVDELDPGLGSRDPLPTIKTDSIARDKKQTDSIVEEHKRQIDTMENSLSVATPTIQIDSIIEEDNHEENGLVSSHGSHDEQVETCAIQHEIQCGEREIHSNETSGLTEDRDVSMPLKEREPVTTEGQEKEDKGNSDTVEGKYEHIKAQISEKLKHVREHASSISIEKKESRRTRRKASENVELASERYKEIEKKLEEACETEDFEMADHLSESLVEAEKEKEGLLNALREAEAHCDAIDLKMEEALEHQITVEEECASLLQLFSKDAFTEADLVLETVEANFSKDIDQWFMSAEYVESKKLELEIESQLINDTRATFNGSVDPLVENEAMEKEALFEKKKILTHELEELLRLVKEKEAEIAENDLKIEVVEKRISEVFSGFNDVQRGVDANYGKLQIVLSQMESESEALSKRKEEIDNLLSQGKKRVDELRKLAAASLDQANMYEENLKLRKAIVLSVLKAREEKSRLAKTEEKILEDTQLLKQEISVARASLQELSSKKSNIQQEGASLKQRLLFINKRVPELEAEKKVAATSRNFKEAARIASEAKSLAAEKETQEAKLKESKLELGKIDNEIDEITIKLSEFEELVISKEREAAMARIQRLTLILASALNERSAALELGDVEEANVLLAEAEIANSEAKQLQLVHNISEKEFGNLSAGFISMEVLSSLNGKQLEELAAGGNQSPR